MTASSPDGAAPGEVFAALADDTRRQLLSMLADKPQSASALSRHVGITRQAVAKHLTSLQAAALISPQRAGREVRYVVQPDALGPAMAWIKTTTALWENRLDRLQAELDEG